MKDTGHLLKRLLQTARQAPRAGADEQAPFGFALRVAARRNAPAPPPSNLALWERFAVRTAVALAVAAVVAGVATQSNWTAPDDDAAAMETQLNQLVFDL